MKWMATVIAACFLLGGCQLFGGTKVQSAADKLKERVKPYAADEKTSLTIFGYDEQAFLRNYSPSYLVNYPNIDINFVARSYQPPGTGSAANDPSADPYADLIKQIEAAKPDLLVLDPTTMGELGKRGLLDNLDPYIKQDRFDLQTLSPAVVDYIRKRGDGKLYGLGPFFYSSVLVYNKDLFDKYHVTYPKEGMTWPELLELAKKFTGAGSGSAEGTSGLYVSGDFGRLVRQMETTEGVADVDLKMNQAKFDDDAHRKIWSTAADALRSGLIRIQQPNDQQVPFQTPIFRSYADPFISGQAAMAIEPSNNLGLLPMLKGSNLQSFDWQWTTPPLGPAGSPYFQVPQVFVIDAKAANKRAAWQLLNYWNSEEYANYQEKVGALSGGSYSINLFSRTTADHEIDGRSLEPFYKPPAAERDWMQSAPGASFVITALLYPLIQQQLQAVADGSATVDEALATLQKKVQDSLHSLPKSK